MSDERHIELHAAITKLQELERRRREVTACSETRA